MYVLMVCLKIYTDVTIFGLFHLISSILQFTSYSAKHSNSNFIQESIKPGFTYNFFSTRYYLSRSFDVPSKIFRFGDIRSIFVFYIGSATFDRFGTIGSKIYFFTFPTFPTLSTFSCSPILSNTIFLI